MKDGSLFYDGAMFACNPSAWGLVLAATKVKIESIMLISVGTGNPDLPAPEKPVGDGFFESAVSRLGGYYKDTKKFLFTQAGLYDNGKEKKGIKDWINIELVASLYLDCQKQNEQVLNMLKPAMGKNYWRFNPRVEKKIDMAKAGDEEISTLAADVKRYLKDPAEQHLISQCTDALIAPEDYEEKALKYLHKAANLINYSKTLSQKADE